MAEAASGLQKANYEANSHVFQASKDNMNVQSALKREIREKGTNSQKTFQHGSAIQILCEQKFGLTVVSENESKKSKWCLRKIILAAMSTHIWIKGNLVVCLGNWCNNLFQNLILQNIQ